MNNAKFIAILLLLLVPNLLLAQYNSLWSINIGTDRESDLMYKVKNKGGLLLPSSDDPSEIKLVGKFDKFINVILVFYLANASIKQEDSTKNSKVVYAGYAQIKAASDEEAKSIYHYLLRGMSNKYGAASDSTGTRVDWLSCGLDTYRRRIDLKQDHGFEVVVSIFNTGIRKGLRQLSTPIDLNNGLRDY